MARKFADAGSLFHYLLDRREAGVANPIAYPDYAAFVSVTAADGFIKELKRAQQQGAISVAYGNGARQEQVSHVRLKSADALYPYLGRKALASVVELAHSHLTEGLDLHSGLIEIISTIKASWNSAKAWNGLLPSDVDKLRNGLLLAQAILDEKHLGTDYRTFSRRITGDSKALERAEGIVVRLLNGIREMPPCATPREALRTLGLEKFAPPLLISGNVEFEGADLSFSRPYIGIPPNEAGRLRFPELPRYLLTIENFASFNRHIAEADPTRLGATIYVGGYPSLAMQRALRILTSGLPTMVPIFHWSDIDADGIWIFRTIEQAVERSLLPHLMSPEIAEQRGTPSPGRTTLRLCPRSSGIFSLAEYLMREGAKTLEQEELDPHVPGIVGTTTFPVNPCSDV